MKRVAFGLLLLLAACQSPLARDYPAPWTRMSPEGLAALNALAMGGVGLCVERRHATIPNQMQTEAEMNAIDAQRAAEDIR
jgi:hypothetical protein